jgi:hypothetical protein
MRVTVRKNWGGKQGQKKEGRTKPRGETEKQYGMGIKYRKLNHQKRKNVPGAPA